MRPKLSSRCWGRSNNSATWRNGSKMFLVSVWCLLLESTRETKENQRDYCVGVGSIKGLIQIWNWSGRRAEHRIKQNALASKLNEV